VRFRHIRLALVGTALVVSVPAAGPAVAQDLTVTGYADFEAWVEKIGSEDKEFYFDNHHVNLILVGRLTGNLFAAAEVEYEHAGEEIALEYGYLGYTGFKDVRILAGKFIVPIGRFNKDLHPTPINKIPGRPHGFSDILPQTYNDVGIWVTGAKAIGEDNRFTFDLFAVNGLLGEDGGNIRGMRDNVLEEAEFGRDDNKAIGGRLGFDLPYIGIDIGGSLYTGKYAETAGGTDLNLTLLGADASFQRSGFVLRGEVVRASQDATGGDLTKTGGYVQASYLVTSKFEPVVRYSAKQMPDLRNDLARFELGVSLYVSSASSVRVAYAINTEKNGFKADNDTFVTQFNVFF